MQRYFSIISGITVFIEDQKVFASQYKSVQDLTFKLAINSCFDCRATDLYSLHELASTCDKLVLRDRTLGEFAIRFELVQIVESM